MSTRADLLRLARAGSARELGRARWAMRRRRLLELWIELGVRLGHVVSPLLLAAVYATAFLPFGVVGRWTRSRPGWQRPRHTPAREIAGLRS